MKEEAAVPQRARRKIELCVGGQNRRTLQFTWATPPAKLISIVGKYFIEGKKKIVNLLSVSGMMGLSWQ